MDEDCGGEIVPKCILMYAQSQILTHSKASVVPKGTPILLSFAVVAGVAANRDEDANACVHLGGRCEGPRRPGPRGTKARGGGAEMSALAVVAVVDAARTSPQMMRASRSNSGSAAWIPDISCIAHCCLAVSSAVPTSVAATAVAVGAGVAGRRRGTIPSQSGALVVVTLA